MVVSTLLLTADNYYTVNNGRLPARPDHDKTLLTELCRNKGVSAKAYKMLPPSIRDIVRVGKTEIPITIMEIANLSDMIIVSRSTDTSPGDKKFRLTAFQCLVKDEKVEIWIRR